MNQAKVDDNNHNMHSNGNSENDRFNKKSQSVRQVGNNYVHMQNLDKTAKNCKAIFDSAEDSTYEGSGSFNNQMNCHKLPPNNTEAFKKDPKASYNINLTGNNDFSKIPKSNNPYPQLAPNPNYNAPLQEGTRQRAISDLQPYNRANTYGYDNRESYKPQVYQNGMNQPHPQDRKGSLYNNQPMGSYQQQSMNYQQKGHQQTQYAFPNHKGQHMAQGQSSQGISHKSSGHTHSDEPNDLTLNFDAEDFVIQNLNNASLNDSVLMDLKELDKYLININPSVYAHK